MYDNISNYLVTLAVPRPRYQWSFRQWVVEYPVVLYALVPHPQPQQARPRKQYYPLELLIP